MLKTKGAFAEHLQLEVDSMKEALSKASKESEIVKKDLLDQQNRFEVMTLSRAAALSKQ